MRRIMKRMWLLLGVTLFALFFNRLAEGQRRADIPHNPVGAYRVFPETNFSCHGRPAGYYADIETECEIYHMCDSLGQQFSYACPNTTLFQQRMLVCDHWYMVNCSRAESNYAANLLIGQQDKPFVGEEEHELRTPRPDLLDRPYAFDYSGDSYRKQFKSHEPAVQNAITGVNYHKTNSNKVTNGGTVFETSTAINNQPQYFVPRHWSTHFNKPFEATTPTNAAPKTNDRRNVKGEAVEINRRSDDDLNFDYSSAPSSSDQVTDEVKNSPPQSVVEVRKNINIRPPSILYEPPFFFPDYRKQFANADTTQRSEIEEPTTMLETTDPTTVSTTIPPPLPKLSLLPSLPPLPAQTTIFKPIESAPRVPESKNTKQDYDFSKYIQQNRNITKTPAAKVQPSKSTAQLRTSQLLSVPPTPQTRIIYRPQSQQFGTTNVLSLPAQPTPFSNDNNNLKPAIQVPSLELQPPREKITLYDDATTQGPPIYYEWKWAVPALELEPPKLEDDSKNLTPGRSTDEAVINKSPTPRSIEFSNPLSVQTATGKTVTTRPKPEHNYRELMKTFFIPDFQFPLEKDGRTGYEHKEAKNSFQINIPGKISNDRPWYGENINCPECHPSFLKPGTCEPCIKIR